MLGSTDEKTTLATDAANNSENGGLENGPKFRSVLPHEPLPISEDDGWNKGYVHLQGAFEPKQKRQTFEPDSEQKPYWNSSSELEEAVFSALTDHHKELGIPFPLRSVSVLDEKNLSRLRLEYDSPYEALQIQYAFRDQKISPQQILQTVVLESNGRPSFGCRPCQATMITTKRLPSDTSSYWPRSNPPQFRRLLHDRGNDEEERSKTRFVYVTGIRDSNEGTDNERKATVSEWWSKPYVVYRAIREVFGTDVEIFLPKKQSRQMQNIQSFHMGFRSPQDAQAIVQKFQGKVVRWDNYPLEVGASQTHHIKSSQLFLDYATITQKSKAKQRGEYEKGQGDLTRPECTSTTSHIHVPGLVIMKDFLNEAEEKILVAVLNGPQAPWAPQQTNKSQTGVVKRQVQHYGYVFDYQSADVLRRDKEVTPVSADCPPLPAIESLEPEKDMQNMDELIQQGRGWEVLARVIEKVRKCEFETRSSTSDSHSATDNGISKKVYPNLNQMTVNVYKPGEGIGSHVDTPSAFGDGLISVSLNSDIVMEFTKVVANKTNDGDKPALCPKKLVYLPRRSLVLMSGPARYEWEHQIVTRRTDTHNGVTFPRGLRISLTLRTALSMEGSILPPFESSSFPPVWGNSGVTSNQTNESKNALITPSTERDHVHAVYDAIATQWHHTRGKRGVLWPSATQFVKNLPEGSIVADVGCGDGKYFPAIWEAGSYVIGTDISLPLLETTFDESSGSTVPDTRKVSDYRKSLQKRPSVAVADCMSVPLRDGSCDAAICIAVMHHLSNIDRRLRCIEELSRIVKPNGRIHIQAWALEQAANSRRRFAAPDVFVPFNAQPKYLEKVLDENGDAGSSKSQQSWKGNSGDSSSVSYTSKSVAELYSEAYEKAEFDERKGLVVFQRYCHMYREGELDDLVCQIPSVRLIESGYESGNHYVILEVK